MAVDVVGKRQKAAAKFRNETDLLLSFEQPTYTADVKTGETVVYAYGLLDAETPSRDRDVENEDVILTVAALQVDATGALLEPETVLVLAAGDLLVWEGRKIPVLRPRAVAPTGEPIIYDRLVAGVRKSAAA